MGLGCWNRLGNTGKYWETGGNRNRGSTRPGWKRGGWAARRSQAVLAGAVLPFPLEPDRVGEAILSYGHLPTVKRVKEKEKGGLPEQTRLIASECRILAGSCPLWQCLV